MGVWAAKMTNRAAKPSLESKNTAPLAPTGCPPARSFLCSHQAAQTHSHDTDLLTHLHASFLLLAFAHRFSPPGVSFPLPLSVPVPILPTQYHPAV